VARIYVASDVFDIALDAMSVLEHDCSRRFVNLREPWTFLRENPFAARSRRRTAVRDDGHPHLAAGLPANMIFYGNPERVPKPSRDGAPPA